MPQDIRGEGKSLSALMLPSQMMKSSSHKSWLSGSMKGMDIYGRAQAKMMQQARGPMTSLTKEYFAQQ